MPTPCGSAQRQKLHWDLTCGWRKCRRWNQRWLWRNCERDLQRRRRRRLNHLNATGIHSFLKWRIQPPMCFLSLSVDKDYLPPITGLIPPHNPILAFHGRISNNFINSPRTRPDGHAIVLHYHLRRQSNSIISTNQSRRHCNRRFTQFLLIQPQHVNHSAPQHGAQKNPARNA